MGSQANASAPKPDVRRVLDALRWIVRELRIAPGTGGPAGLSAAQQFALHVLRERGPLSLGELAELTATDPSSISVVIHKLHAKGLVGKKSSAEDRRRLKVTLTAAGARAVERSPAPVQQELISRMAQLEPDQLRSLADLLERVAPPREGTHPAPMFFQEGAEEDRP